MKRTIFIPSIILAIAVSVASLAEDKPVPQKPGTSLGNPSFTTPSRFTDRWWARTDSASEPSDDAVKTPNPAGVQSQFSGAITAVSRDEKTITVSDAAKAPHRLHIGDTTRMKRGDKDATWDDLKVGVKVDGTCSGDEETAHAETLNIQG